MPSTLYSRLICGTCHGSCLLTFLAPDWQGVKKTRDIVATGRSVWGLRLGGAIAKMAVEFPMKFMPVDSQVLHNEQLLHDRTTNYIGPDAIQAGRIKVAFSDDDIAAVWAKTAGLRRLGEPIDIARAMLFLASDDMGGVSGCGLTVDSGLTLRT